MHASEDDDDPVPGVRGAIHDACIACPLAGLDVAHDQPSPVPASRAPGVIHDFQYLRGTVVQLPDRLLRPVIFLELLKVSLHERPGQAALADVPGRWTLRILQRKGGPLFGDEDRPQQACRSLDLFG